MSIKKLLKLCFGLFRHPLYTCHSLLNQLKKKNDININKCIRDAANWLVKAQVNAPDGEGFSRRYSLISGWDCCYIETTGYIIPTLIDVSDYSGDNRYRDSAFKAANWLLNIQLANGAFTDIDSYKPQVFDTGQVLLGLNRMYRETGDERFLESLTRAGRWLTDIQEKDGSWIRYAYNNRPHAYYTRVAAALIEAGQIAGIDEYIEAGTRNLEWALGQRQENGYYQYSEFKPGEDAILHTIVYVLEGFSMAFKLTGEQRWADAMIDGTDVIARIATDKGLLFSQYDTDWQVTNKEYCVTGLAQYAGICFDASSINGNMELRDQGERVLRRLCSWQQGKGYDIEGSLQSSVPLWGYYGGMEFFNWNVKFFLDAALKSMHALKSNKDN
jgi:uncharacterized protein YyaL (SSP411 family)